MRPSIALLTAFTSSAVALEVLPNSPCAVQCGNNIGNTTGADIACLDSDYGTTPGQTFQTCVACQLSSTYVDPTTQQTDLQWALYNMRYAFSWCVFGYPNNTNVGSSPCSTGFACGQIQTGFEFDSLAMQQGEYAYCSQYPSNLVPKCTNCTAQVASQMYLTNFAVFLNAACEQQPVSGKTVSIAGSVFSSNLIVITSPSAQATGTFTASKGGITLGDKIGIAVGAILAILGVTGFCIVWNGRRRRRRILARHQQQTGYAEWAAQQEAEAARANRGGMVQHQSPIDPGSAGGFFDSPQSTRPLVRPWNPGHKEEESPMSAVGEKAYFSPYSSNYNSPQSANDAVMREWPLDRKGSISGAGRNRSVEREEPGDRIEMQNVPPVLHHPGYGRGAAPYLPGLSEEDARRGTAL